MDFVVGYFDYPYHLNRMINKKIRIQKYLKILRKIIKYYDVKGLPNEVLNLALILENDNH